MIGGFHEKGRGNAAGVKIDGGNFVRYYTHLLRRLNKNVTIIAGMQEAAVVRCGNRR